MLFIRFLWINGTRQHKIFSTFANTILDSVLIQKESPRVASSCSIRFQACLIFARLARVLQTLLTRFGYNRAMKTLRRERANILWDVWWDEMHDEWFKVEVLQDYSGEDAGPSLNQWLKGYKEQSIQLMKLGDYSEWIQDCQKKLNQGVNLIRIHVTEEPLTPYMEWELQHYKIVNIPKCGEKVHLVSRSDILELELPAGDLMIFDKKRVVVNKYNSRGLMTHQTFYDENDDINKFLELRKMLMEHTGSS